MKARASIWTWLAVISMAGPGLARAQAGTEAAEQESARRLGGHDFILSEFVPSPFATTEFALVTALGFASLHVSGTDASGNPVNATYDLAGISQTGRFQVSLLPWLALRVAGGGNTLFGTNSDAALNYGGDFGYLYGAGAQVSIPLGPVRVGGSLDVAASKTYHFNVNDAIAASLAAGRVTSSTLLTVRDDLTVAPGVQVAMAFHPAVGAYGHVRYSYDTTTTSGASTSTSFLDAGAALSFDLKPLPVGVPIGFLASYNLRKELKDGGDTEHQIAGGVYYTGRRSLSIGLEVRATLSTPAAGADLKIYESTFGMRYYW